MDKTENVTTTDVQKYCMNHTMIRIKDPEKSLKFYQEVMGMKLVRTRENPENKFNLYFLAYPGGKKVPEDDTTSWEGLLELTWNYGEPHTADTFINPLTALEAPRRTPTSNITMAMRNRKDSGTSA